MRVVIFAVAVLLTCLRGAEAKVLSANQLREGCSSPKGSPGDLICTEYVQGFVGGIEVADSSKSKDARIWCFPKEVTIGQVRLVIEKYMREHPEALHQDAALISGIALMFAFSCKNSN